MPAEGIHLTALREAAFLASLATPARRCLVRFEAAARLGAVAPDLPYFDHYVEAFVRYVARSLVPGRASPWGARIHEGGGAIPLVRVVLEHARHARSELLAALALGLASHACIDRAIHPLVNALARRFPEGSSPAASHLEVEKFQSILFHERYFGRDHMGTPAVARLIFVPVRELLRETAAGPALVTAFAHATKDSNTKAPLRRMAAGYELHARVIGSPLVGKRAAPPAEKERARPLFLEGPWGTFERVLEEAIAYSRPVLDAVWTAFAASDSNARDAFAALENLLPAGSIEGQGRDVDLSRPFIPRPPSELDTS